MDHDEAFLQEIREAPGDDAPRLVYADWLEERGDPRGAYVRAEAAWARGRDRGAEAEARRRAEGLDPVWVARVSRPPLGVCCVAARFKRGGPRRTPADLDRVEERLGARLPADYRAFLLDYNGGVPDPPCVPDPRHKPPGPLCLMIGQFFRSEEGEGDNEVESEHHFVRSIHRDDSRDRPFPAEGMLPVADTLHDLGLLLVGIAPDTFGKVFHFTDWARNLEAPTLAELAPSFAALLERLTPDLED
jgi:uncharacterized protein (TIGR02996 family)